MSMKLCIPKDELAHYRERLNCNFAELEQVFPDCMEEAVSLLSEAGLKDYLDGASLICMIGRGFEPVLTYLEEMPRVAARIGENSLSLIAQTVWQISRTPNGKTIPFFLQTIAEAARRLGSEQLLRHYVELILDMMERTTVSIHGFHATHPSPGAIDMLQNMPLLLRQLSLEGLKNWIDYGIRNHAKHPERQRDYFGLQSADSRAIMQRERQGTLFIDNERKLNLYLKALWNSKTFLVPYSEAFDELRKPRPYYDALGIRLPDAYDASHGVSGIDRYRALLAHCAAHQRWSEAIIADNFSPFQRLAIETFEDARVDHLACQRYPGLRRILLALHPRPDENACNPETQSCIRHRLAMVSYAMLDADGHGYLNPFVVEFSQRFHQLMAEGAQDTRTIATLALAFVAQTRRQSDQLPNIHFENIEVGYRDDNRHLWRFIESGDEEESFDDPKQRTQQQEDMQTLPPRLYPEWDYHSKTFRPDWVSLYESLHPSGDPDLIDRLLNKHAILARRLKQLMELLKPQQYVRIRYQEDGSELDLDVAIRSLIDFRSGHTPDPRINMSHRHDGRDIAVTLLLDLSASLDDTPPGCEQTILQLSQEAVSLLAHTIEGVGDEFAIAGFSSNTRHEVRYQHIKGFSEHWGAEVKARLAAMEAGYSTRMGSAIRHAGHYLKARKADKKLLLVLTDGEPSDIDVDDDRHLIHDCHKAVQELDQQGVYIHCINLDPKADDYVADIFGQHYTVIDRVERLPEKLPQLFISLTK